MTQRQDPFTPIFFISTTHFIKTPSATAVPSSQSEATTATATTTTATTRAATTLRKQCLPCIFQDREEESDDNSNDDNGGDHGDNEPQPAPIFNKKLCAHASFQLAFCNFGLRFVILARILQFELTFCNSSSHLVILARVLKFQLAIGNFGSRFVILARVV